MVIATTFEYGPFDCSFLDVPVSSQWKSDGHLYPIQIAQFGLSHWSRFKSNLHEQSNDIHRFEQLRPSKFFESFFQPIICV